MPNSNQQDAVYLQSGAAKDENRLPDSYSGGQIGSRFTVAPEPGGDPVNNLGQEWQLVQADSVMDVEPTRGAVAYWLSRTKFLVTTDVSLAGRGNVAGVFGGTVTLGNICCIQREGVAQVQPEGSPTAQPTTAGLIVIPGSSDAKANILAAGTAATYPQLGVSAGATSAVETGLFPCVLSVGAGRV